MPPVSVVIGFIKEADYPLFRRIVADPEGFPESYASWLKHFQHLVQKAQAGGHPVVELAIDPRELADWCSAQGLRVNAGARHMFNVHKTAPDFLEKARAAKAGSK